MDVGVHRGGDGYASLGVAVDARQRDVERAFARWRERFRQGTAGADAYARAELAYHLLADPAARARHDRRIGVAPHPAWRGGDAERAAALWRRGMRCRARGRPERACALLREAVRLDPGEPRYRSWLGLELARTAAGLAEGLRHAGLALERRPGDPALLFNLAAVCAAAGLGLRAGRLRARGWRAIVGEVLRSCAGGCRAGENR